MARRPVSSRAPSLVPSLALLVLAACASVRPAVDDVEAGVLLPGGSFAVFSSDAPPQRIQLVGSDLHIDVGAASAVVRGAGAGGRVPYRREGDVLLLVLRDGSARVDLETLRLGDEIHRLQPGRTLVFELVRSPAPRSSEPHLESTHPSDAGLARDAMGQAPSAVVVIATRDGGD